MRLTTCELENERVLIPRAPPQQRPVAMLPSRTNKKTGAFSCWLSRRASDSDATQGIFAQPITSVDLAYLIRAAMSSGVTFAELPAGTKAVNRKWARSAAGALTANI